MTLEAVTANDLRDRLLEIEANLERVADGMAAALMDAQVELAAAYATNYQTLRWRQRKLRRALREEAAA